MSILHQGSAKALVVVSKGVFNEVVEYGPFHHRYTLEISENPQKACVFCATKI